MHLNPDPDLPDHLAKQDQLVDPEHQERTVPLDHQECKETPDQVDLKDLLERKVTVESHKWDHLVYLDSPDYEVLKVPLDTERTDAMANGANLACLDLLDSQDHREPWATQAIAIHRPVMQQLLFENLKVQPD